MAEVIKNSNAAADRLVEEYADEIVRDEGVSKEEALQRARKGLLAKLLSPAAKASLAALASEFRGTEQAIEDLRHALSSEQAKNLELEAQLAEANERLSKFAELERELDRHRGVAHAEAATKGSGGL